MAAVDPMRTCGVCGVKDIPRGVDWPWWVDGKPTHMKCALGWPEDDNATGHPDEWVPIYEKRV